MALMPQTFLLPVLGILLVTSEWSARAGLVTFTLEPRRGLVVLAKTVAAVVLGLAGLALLLGVAAVATVVGGTGDEAWDVGGRELGYFAMLQTGAILQGVAFGLLLMSSTAAIVLYFALPVAMNLLVQLVPAVRDSAAWIDLATSQAPLYAQAALNVQQWSQVGVTALLWVGLPMLGGYLRLRRREITTA
ncbi:MAG TPA: ABC transporter permease, partial [Propionicimonas sp.]|nr:ABC transporter permease [Propionicimonas sp.]